VTASKGDKITASTDEVLRVMNKLSKLVESHSPQHVTLALAGVIADLSLTATDRTEFMTKFNQMVSDMQQVALKQKADKLAKLM
jgi:hypothetical protein